jgi:hypothetical protein
MFGIKLKLMKYRFELTYFYNILTYLALSVRALQDPEGKNVSPYCAPSGSRRVYKTIKYGNIRELHLISSGLTNDCFPIEPSGPVFFGFFLPLDVSSIVLKVSC